MKISVELVTFGFIGVLVVLLAITVNVSQQQSLPKLGEAPELAGISTWLNSEPLSIYGSKGKVVLVDFWTYTCINCIRTLPHLNAWHEKYKDKGLIIIGVHTPEFEFEKDPENVRAAIAQYGIKYPVALDNDYKTWKAYGNNYWPRHYLVDKEGIIRYDQIGEGRYNETEKAIQELLGIKGDVSQTEQGYDLSKVGTPEIYLGYDFARVPYGNQILPLPNVVTNFVIDNITEANRAYLSGRWLTNSDKIVSMGNASVFLIYRAKNVNIVANGNSSADIFLDGFRVVEGMQGSDVSNGQLIVKEQRLYNIVSTETYATHLLEIRAKFGFELYTFTFG